MIKTTRSKIHYLYGNDSRNYMTYIMLSPEDWNIRVAFENNAAQVPLF